MAKYYEAHSYNRFIIGFLIGSLTPFVFFFLYFMFRFQQLSFTHYIDILIESKKIVHVMSLVVFPNLLPFMFFVKTDRYKSGRGVLAATVLFGILIFVLKFFVG